MRHIVGGAVMGFDRGRIGTLQNMVIGDEMPLAVDEKTGAQTDRVHLGIKGANGDDGGLNVFHDLADDLKLTGRLGTAGGAAHKSGSHQHQKY